MYKHNFKTPSLTSTTDLKIRFSDVDSMQVVWHGQYVRYFEDGREDFGKQFSGLDYMDIFDQGYFAPIVDLQLQYKQPLRYGQVATIETRYIATEAAKICFEYVIRNQQGQIAIYGSSTQVFTNHAGELELATPEFYKLWKDKWNIK